MKQLLSFLFIIFSLQIGIAQSNKDIHSFQFSSDTKAIKRMTHTFHLPAAEVKINLKEKSIKISDQSYEVMFKRGKYYLLDTQHRFHAIWYHRTILVEDQKYKVRRGRLVNMANTNQSLAKVSIERKKRVNTLQVELQAALPTTVLALLFHQQLEAMARYDGTDHAFDYFSYSSAPTFE